MKREDKTLEEFIDETTDAVRKNLIFIETEKGLKAIDFNSVISPHLSRCSTCTFKDYCHRKGEESEKYGCVIEREEIIALIDELTKEGIDIKTADKLIIYPLIQTFLRMNRLYRIEASEKTLSMLNTAEGQRRLKMLMDLIKKAEDSYLKFLKELKATRKEREEKKNKKKEEILELWS